jgi:hypothetical protein
MASGAAFAPRRGGPLYARAVLLRPHCLAAALAALGILAAATPSRGDERVPDAPGAPAARVPPKITALALLPTAVAEAGGPRRVRADDADLGPVATALDALLADTAQDLHLSVVAPPAAGAGRPLGDADLLARARAARAAVLLPSVRAEGGGDVEVRLALARPGASAVEARSARVPRDDLALRAVVLLRDLVSRPAPIAAPPPAPAPEEKLAGRVTLMVNGAALGGLAGASIQLASGSSDPRLLYPLMIAGAGVGLGAAYLASGEWYVGTGDAWFFASGAYWPTAAAHLVFQGRFAATRADSDRWAFGLVGSGLGVTLATLGLTQHHMTDGGALLAHSGGAAGMLIGALVEMGARRSAAEVPFTGMGYGAAIGWLAAATVAVNVRPIWPLRHRTAGLPFLGVVGQTQAGPRSAPAFGLGYSGPLPF